VTAAPRLPALFHVGFVVADLEAAGADYERRYGIPVERVFDLTVEDAELDGAPARFSARYGFLPLGNTDLELIQPLEGDSPYSRFLAGHGDGIHHLAFVVDSIDAYLEHLRATEAGAELVLDARVPGGLRFVYVDGTAYGTVLELVEMPEDFAPPAEATNLHL
jgi:methylmalonyl-CoA/ethylmalonyl-CoA epimerase